MDQYYKTHMVPQRQGRNCTVTHKAIQGEVAGSWGVTMLRPPSEGGVLSSGSLACSSAGSRYAHVIGRILTANSVQCSLALDWPDESLPADGPVLAKGMEGVLLTRYLGLR